MARSAFLVVLAVVALCGVQAWGDWEARRDARRERLSDMSALDLIDAIRHIRGERRSHHEGSPEELTSEEGDDDDHSNGEEEHHEEEEEHIYRFHIGHENFGAFNYLDSHGYAKGFFIDLIQAVCREAGKHCHYLVDDYEHCWRGHEGIEYPGIGLLAGWYDGCIGLSPTPDRLNAFSFTDSFTGTKSGKLYYRADDHPEDMLNLVGKNIGFADGWASGERCLNRQYGIQGNSDDEYVAHHYKNPRLLVKALQNKEIDVIMTTGVLDESSLGLVSAGRSFPCTSGGLSVMTRHGSDLPEWWNTAFRHLRDSGRFARLCTNSAREHADHGKLHCIH